MITIKIHTSTYDEHEGTYEFMQNSIYLGSNYDANLYFPYADVLSNHLFLEVIEANLIIHPHRELKHILVNGKRTSRPKILRKNDRVDLGFVNFEVIAFKYTAEQFFDEDDRSELYEKLKERNTELYEIVKSFKGIHE